MALVGCLCCLFTSCELLFLAGSSEWRWISGSEGIIILLAAPCDASGHQEELELVYKKKQCVLEGTEQAQFTGRSLPFLSNQPWLCIWGHYVAFMYRARVAGTDC